jgi:hypothetical protein
VFHIPDLEEEKVIMHGLSRILEGALLGVKLRSEAI